MSLTQAFHAQNEQARIEQTEQEFTAYAEELLLQRVYMPTSVWFHRKHNELRALNVKDTKLSEPTSGGRGVTAIFCDPITLSFQPEPKQRQSSMVYRALPMTRTRVGIYPQTEANREIGLRLTWQYWGWGGTEHTVKLLFNLDALTTERVFALLDAAWNFLDEHALEGVNHERNFWTGLLIPPPFLIGPMTVSKP